ncbi:MAG: 50S ribosomal protein L31 [Gloeomargarita sp. DG02_4_bins_56]
MPKPGIHPEWYPEAKVFCNGEVVMTVGSTKPQLHVDIWSGNHPFYTGTQKIIDTEGRVERFMRKYSKPAAATSKPKTAEKADRPKPTKPTKKK